MLSPDVILWKVMKSNELETVKKFKMKINVLLTLHISIFYCIFELHACIFMEVHLCKM